MLSPYANFIACDCETGGLPNKTKKAVTDIALTEIALVAIDSDLNIVEKASWLIAPYKDDLTYDYQAQVVSGISKQMCIDQGLQIKDVHKEVVAFLKRYKKGSSLPVILGHNIIKFDADFLLNFFEFCGDDFMKYVNDEPEDTIKWARLAWTESTNFKLGTCCENAGVVHTEAHRALPDTVATAELWIKFLKNLRGEGQPSVTTNAPQKRFRHEFEF